MSYQLKYTEKTDMNCFTFLQTFHYSKKQFNLIQYLLKILQVISITVFV